MSSSTRRRNGTAIRLSTAITVLPLENPVRLAEDVSVVDTLSGGRVEIGVGSGGSEVEYAAFGRDVGRKRELTSEGLDTLRHALANQAVGTTGFTIQPPAGDFTERIWQGVFSGPGAGYAARRRHCAGSTPSTATPTRSSRRC